MFRSRDLDAVAGEVKDMWLKARDPFHHLGVRRPAHAMDVDRSSERVKCPFDGVDFLADAEPRLIGFGATDHDQDPERPVRATVGRRNRGTGLLCQPAEAPINAGLWRGGVAGHAISHGNRSRASTSVST